MVRRYQILLSRINSSKVASVQPEVVVKLSATIKRDDFDVGDVSPLDVSSQMSLACSFVSGTEQIAKAITIARVA